MFNIKSTGTLFYLTVTSVSSQTVLYDVGQCNTCHFSYVPQVGVHVFKFNVVQLILGFY